MVKAQENIRVKIANGDQIMSEGSCDAVPMVIQEIEFYVYMFVLVLAGCDVVLGI